MISVGIIGSGFIAKGFYLFSQGFEEIRVSSILTRGDIKKRQDIPQPLLTNDIEKLISNSDIILECSGDTIHTTNCVNEALKAEIPVITMNSEFHITCGSYFYKKGILFEAQGDQSGCIYKLNEEVLDMGFIPLIFGNYKKYLKYDVDLSQAEYWSKKNNISLDKTIAFTDGTKVEIENTFIANSLDAEFYDLPTNNKLDTLVDESLKSGKKYVDYFLDENAPSGVFIATCHQKEQNEYLKYLGFKERYQLLEIPFHFWHLEIYKSIKDVFSYKIKNQMRNENKKYMVASLLKTPLKVGDFIKQGLGSIEFRGIHNKYNKNLVPITLLNDMTIKKDLEPNHLLSFDDVEYNNNLATKIWREHVK
jgi:predicted homoserine dehydrogenase-like protein